MEISNFKISYDETKIKTHSQISATKLHKELLHIQQLFAKKLLNKEFSVLSQKQGILLRRREFCFSNSILFWLNMTIGTFM